MPTRMQMPAVLVKTFMQMQLVPGDRQPVPRPHSWPRGIDCSITGKMLWLTSHQSSGQLESGAG